MHLVFFSQIKRKRETCFIQLVVEFCTAELWHLQDDLKTDVKGQNLFVTWMKSSHVNGSDGGTAGLQLPTTKLL